jgi:hypothetical protein
MWERLRGKYSEKMMED